MNYVLSLFLIGIAILAHELGHFLAARWVGIPIRLFSIGFGPRVWGVRRGSTEYRISLIPIGGYVLPDIEDEDQFFRLPVSKRMILSVGGPVASVVLPLFCFMILNVVSHGFSLAGLFVRPFAQLMALMIQMVGTIPVLFSRPDQLSGVVGIVAHGGQIISGSFLKGLHFLAFMSLNLGVLNLLPIPALDGGKMLLYLLEKIHPGFLRLHVPLAIAGWVLIVGLMLYVTVMDVGRLL